MKPFIFLQLIAILSIPILFSSCSNGLEKKEATDLISKIPNEIVTGNITITVNTGNNYYKEVLLADYKDEYDHLIENGILTNMQIIQGTDRVPYASNTEIVYKITSNFTDTAKALIINGNINGYWDQKFVVKCGELIFVEVTDIFQEEKSKTAEIEYKVSFIPTMYAKFAKMNSNYEEGKTYTKKLTAKQYENGWRINK